jgi:hypothetical protein
LLEILQFTGGLIVAYFSKDLLLYSILSKLYQVNQPNSKKKMSETRSKARNLDITNSGEKDVDKSQIKLNRTSKVSKVKVIPNLIIFRSGQSLIRHRIEN